MFAIWQELLAFQQAFNVDKTGIFETLQMSLQQIASHGDIKTALWGNGWLSFAS
ncbi:MAG: hypothetical protein R2865_01355 [Deinococcales bacterium]